jgi:hypothetical protein
MDGWLAERLPKSQNNTTKTTKAARTHPRQGNAFAFQSVHKAADVNAACHEGEESQHNDRSAHISREKADGSAGIDQQEDDQL